MIGWIYRVVLFKILYCMCNDSDTEKHDSESCILCVRKVKQSSVIQDLVFYMSEWTYLRIEIHI